MILPILLNLCKNISEHSLCVATVYLYSCAKTILTPSSCASHAWVQQPGWRAGSERCSGLPILEGRRTTVGRREVQVRRCWWWCSTGPGTAEAEPEGRVRQMGPSSLSSLNPYESLAASKTQHLQQNKTRKAQISRKIASGLVAELASFNYTGTMAGRLKGKGRKTIRVSEARA